MAVEVNLYCHLYVDANVSEEALATDLAKLLGARAEGESVSTKEGDLSVRRNKEFDAEMRKDPLDGFLYYHLHVDVEPAMEIGREKAVAFISNLLEHLWSRDYPAVAACDYEDDLPHKGGYKSVYTPSVHSEEQAVEW